MTHVPPKGGRVLLRLLAVATLFSAIGPVSTFAQVTTATLSGTVEDTTNAVIPDAAITLKNTASGAVRTTQSDGSGVFAIPSVPTGDYQLTIAAKGFKGYTASQIHLDPGDQRALRDIHLSLGGETDTVNVNAESQINIDSGELSSVISAQQIEHLSIEGRDVTELFKTLPGFALVGSGSDNRGYDPSQVSVNGALGSYAGNGTPLNGVALLTDGADVTDPGNFGAAIQNVNYEQVAEVKVQTSSFTADTAHGPIVINAVGKSGGDKYHGSLYTYARTSQLNSNDWISKYTNQAQPPDRQVYPGFTFGGPVKLPGTGFNSTNHLTFFVGAEDYAQRNVYAYGGAGSATLTALVPTAGMRTGDFSQAQLQQFLGPNYTPTPGSNGVSCLNGNYKGVCAIPQSAPDGSPLANGQIPTQFIDKGGQALLNTLPLPNTPSNGTYNWITTNLTDNNLWQAHGRIDDQLGSRTKVFAVYTKEAGKSGVPQNEYYSARGNFGGTNLPGGGLLSTINSQTGSFNITTVFGATLTNELYGQGAYLLQNFVAKTQGAFNSSAIGYPYQGIYANNDPQYPTLEDYGNLPVNRTPDVSAGGIYAKKWIRGGGDNLTKLFGAHTVKVGVFTELSNNNEVNAFQNPNGTIGSIGFPNNTFTDPKAGLVYNTGPLLAPDGTVNVTNVGNNIANFLEGHVAAFSQSNINIHPDLYFWNIAGYAQDHWRLSSKLTLDIGLRLEHLTPFTDTRNDGVPVWDASSYNSGKSPLPGFLWHGIDSSIPKGGIELKSVFYEPRVGLAYDPRGTGQTIFRAGYGIYTAHDSFNDASAGMGASEGQVTNTVNFQLLSTISGTQLPISAAGASAQNSSPSAYLRGDSQQPKVYTYNAAVDQKLPFNSTLEIAYVGNRSQHLLDSGANNGVVLDDQNKLPIGALFGGNIPTQIGTQTQNVALLTQAQQNAFRPFPFYTHVQAASHRLYSNFNALETSWSKQSGAFLYSVNYTWSKALGVRGADGEATNPSDPFVLRNNYSAESFDRTHIFNANYSYSFGHLLNNRYAGIVANGWQLSGITQIQSGQNVQTALSPNLGLSGGLGTADANTPVSATALLGTPDYLLQPVVTCDPNHKTAPHQLINGACFSLPSAPGINGTYVFPYIHAPAYTETDLTAIKDIKIGDRQNVQFRVAAFNFLNHANSSFNNADVNGNETSLNLSNNNATTNEASATIPASGKNFGYVPLREGRRIMELSLKYSF